MPKPSDQYQYIEPAKAEKLLEAIEKQLKTKFCEIYETKYNRNTKGYDYEEILAEFFEEYLGGAFDFLVRVGVMDWALDVNSVLTPQKNEFDVVAIYKNAVPKLVHHRIVPYDSIAFITEVKQTLKITDLKKDLLKFSKISKLNVTNNRPKTTAGVFTAFKIKRPLRFLFYYESKAKEEKVFEILEGEYGKAWDICVVLKENVVYLNSTLPFVQDQFKGIPFVRDLNYSLLKGMFFTCTSIEGTFVDSWVLFWNLFRSILRKNKTNISKNNSI